MTWKRQPFGKRRKNDAFDEVVFEDPKLIKNLQSYAHFIYTRIAFPQGTPCGIRKNQKFHSRGDLSPLLLREHAEGETVMGVSPTHPETGQTKAACICLPNTSVIEAVGQACRILSAFEQESIRGFMELCPDDRIRVWALFPIPTPTREALKCMHYLKKRAFVSNKGETFPKGGDAFLELPPYRDSKTGKWSKVMTLEDGENFLEGKPLPKEDPDWSELVWIGRAREDNDNDTLLGFLEETYKEGWEQEHPHPVEASDPLLAKSPLEGPTKTPPAVDPEPEAVVDLEDLSQESEEEPDFHPSLLSALSASVPTVIGRLLDPAATSIPNAGRVLGDVLNGGWAAQRLYLIAGPSGEGKTTFCSWASDYAASHQVPVLFVSFQLPKEQMAIYALARNAQIDSAKIERRVWMEEGHTSDADLTKRLISAGRHYFHTGDYLHLLEADLVTTAYDVERGVQQMRDRTGIPDNEPVLVIVDSLREMRPVVERSPNDGASSSNLAQVANELKRLAWSANAAVIATLDVPSRNLNRLQWTAPATLELDLDYCAAAPNADTAFLIESRCTRIVSPIQGTGALFGEEQRLLDPLDHLLEEAGHHPKLARRIQQTRKDHPLEKSAASTYCRLVPLKNRGGRIATHPIFRYDRAYHDFKPIELDNAKIMAEPSIHEGVEETVSS